MSKTKKKLTKEEKLAKDRLRKRQKYEEIKNNPELFKIKQEKDRKNYLLRKEQKKIRNINEMSARAQREQRKRWKKNSLKYKKKKREQNKVEKILVNDTPEAPKKVNETRNISPEIPEPNQIIVDSISSDKPTTPQLNKELRHKISATPTSSNRKFRYKVTKTINKLQKEINQLKKEKRNLQIKLKKQHEVRQKSLEDTIEKNVTKAIKEIKSGEIEEVKKRLIFNETFTHQVKLNYKKLDKTEKRSFAERIVCPNDARLRKHKLITKVPFTIRSKLKKKENKNEAVIQRFFEDDSNSRMASGKNEYIKRCNSKKQKRYLNDSLKNLHQKFCKEHGMISYTVFCKNRPYWIVFPKDNRDTCQCKLHSNVNLLIKALKKSNIISENSATDVLNSLCCDPYNENCLGRSCTDCVFHCLCFFSIIHMPTVL
ncbi:myb-like protein X isoform X1 [Maniola jurtina]|uniref:myb-like protein X isoform X1 n=1 Tax=Maniola jurtina TaxID=191418 RepID=UPI001E6885FF|nr:myb-like protein X isoform X1 [Maniola jurtina]XP_045772046.1 myb-like protein X isoform X2 [Maniola jurtina]XP_045772055.1 myb-like protein X isoform X1 [Maniola jurtina]